MKKSVLILLGIVVLGFWLQSCGPETPPMQPGEQGPTPLALDIPSNWPKPNLLAENPITVEGVALGRKLFYDKMLSGNESQACADCHHQSAGFTDLQKQFSVGSNGDVGNRNGMPLFNLNWSSGYFWDGRQPTLESLIEEPMEAHNEMNLDIEIAVDRLQAHPDYPELFSKAFPNQGITTTTLRFAIAQFLRTIITGAADTKWTKYFMADPRHPETFMTDQEARGFIAFSDPDKGDCFHCHNPSPLFMPPLGKHFANNGLDANPDTGHFKATGNPNHIGFFKVPSLRNLSFTAPYMHDGRFATLKEVLEHYNTGFHYSSTLDVNLFKHLDDMQKPKPRMTEQEMDDIIVFLKLLDDETLLTNPKWSKP